jgi:hypothetical protein
MKAMTISGGQVYMYIKEFLNLQKYDMHFLDTKNLYENSAGMAIEE